LTSKCGVFAGVEMPRPIPFARPEVGACLRCLIFCMIGDLIGGMVPLMQNRPMKLSR